MSPHDLRNIAHVISNAIEIIRQAGGDDPMIVGSIRVIDRQLKELLRLADELGEKVIPCVEPLAACTGAFRLLHSRH